MPSRAEQPAAGSRAAASRPTSPAGRSLGSAECGQGSAQVDGRNSAAGGGPGTVAGGRQPRLYVFFGMIATGKSTLAAAWAARQGLAYANSDVVRKELAGLAPTTGRREAPGQGIYAPGFTRRTYDELLRRAELELAADRDMVLDASYLDRAQRQRPLELARRLGARALFIYCECSEAVKKERLELRARDPQAVSDGRWEIYLRQQAAFTPLDDLPPEQLLTLNSDRPVAELLAAIEEHWPLSS